MRDSNSLRQEIASLKNEAEVLETAAAGGKITINGSFGKFGSKWSTLYSPSLLIQTTITGQLSLLMLIEQLSFWSGIEVVSANTDGIVIKCHKDFETDMLATVKNWEEITQFETEETRYDAIYSRDVNNYVALKAGGGVKLKGVFAEVGLAKNPTNEVCVDAVTARLVNGTPVEKTIHECTDIRKFVNIRKVNGGAVKGDEFLGKAVRWYYAVGETGTINYSGSGYIVARSLGAKPLMMLPDLIPDDLDYDWYIKEAHDILADVGFKE